MRKLITVVALPVAVIGALACGGLSTPSDEGPSEPKKIAKKSIDPPHYKNVTSCVKKDSKGKCIKSTSTKKQTDDKDWLLVTADGTTYDVTESEYNSVNVGDWWPR